MTIANTTLQLGSSEIQIASSLVGRVVRYLNKDYSTVTKDGVRTFKIEAVERVFFCKDNRRCVTVRAKDVDDSGEEKFRTLHLDGIATVV